MSQQKEKKAWSMISVDKIKNFSNWIDFHSLAPGGKPNL